VNLPGLRDLAESHACNLTLQEPMTLRGAQLLAENIAKAMPKGQNLQVNIFFLRDVVNLGTITGNVAKG